MRVITYIALSAALLAGCDEPPTMDVETPDTCEQEPTANYTSAYETFDWTAESNGRAYRIQVALPVTYALDPTASFPVMYVTDADLLFGTAAEAANLAVQDRLDPGIAPAIMVGIGYEDPATWAFNRTLDFSPEGSLDPWFIEFLEDALGVAPMDGGADEFLDFIENELHPELKRRYRVAGETAGLMTNSQGGVFGTYAFLANRPLFDRYWIGSPNIFGPGTYLVDEVADRLAEGFDRPTRVYMSIGEYERTWSVGASMPQEMHQLAAASYDGIEQQLAAVQDPNFTFDSQEFEGETHNTVISAAITRAYRFLMRP